MMVDQEHQAGQTSLTTATVAGFFRSMPTAMRMVYVGGAVMLIATRMPYANVNFDGDVEEVAFSSSAFGIVLLAVGLIAWLCVPAITGRLTKRRRVGTFAAIVVLGVAVAGAFGNLPKVARESDPFGGGLNDLLGTSPPTASPAIGLIALAVGLAIIVVGFLRLRNGSPQPTSALPAPAPSGFAPPPPIGLPAPTDIHPSQGPMS